VAVVPLMRREIAELGALVGAALEAAAVPFWAIAASWKAVKFLSLVSTALMELPKNIRLSKNI
jgi:hypothetical protein